MDDLLIIGVQISKSDQKAVCHTYIHTYIHTYNGVAYTQFRALHRSNRGKMKAFFCPTGDAALW